MKKYYRKIFYIILSLIAVIFVLGLTLAFIQTKAMVDNKSISPVAAGQLRQHYTEPNQLLTATDEETLFLRA